MPRPGAEPGPAPRRSRHHLGEVAGQLQALGAVVLGIRGNTPFSHAEYHKRHALPFPLLSDVHRRVIQAYDVWDEERNVAYPATVGFAGRRRATG